MPNDRGRAPKLRVSRVAKRLAWTLLAMVAAGGLWVARVELTYRRNVRHLPASFEYRRHVETRLWTA